MKEKLIIWIAWKMPRSLIKWCAVRLMANATTGQYGHEETPKVTCIEALKRWK